MPNRYIASTLKDLPKPQFVEAIAWQVFSDQMQQHIQQSSNNEYIWLPSDPLVKLLDITADQNVKARQRINEAALATTTAHAKNSDLDHRGATLYKTFRLVLDDSDPDNIIYENDDPYRERIELAMEGRSNAGPEGAYEYYAREASAQIKDARAHSPSPSVAHVYILSSNKTGIADDALIETCYQHLSDKLLRPAGDRLTVKTAEVVHYTLNAEMFLYDGISEETAKLEAISAFETYQTRSEKIGHGATLSGIDDALKTYGVYDVIPVAIDTQTGEILSFPVGANQFQAAICDDLVITIGVKE